MTIEKTKLAKAVEEEFNEAVKMSAELSETLLMEQGWDILEELHKATFASVVSTSLIMIPAMKNKDKILDSVSDPVAFSKNLETASTEIAGLIKSVQLLHNGHINKKGSPTIDDMDLVSDLTIGYSKIQTSMETSVQPLLLAMVDHLQEAGVDTEAVFLKENEDE